MATVKKSVIDKARVTGKSDKDNNNRKDSSDSKSKNQSTTSTDTASQTPPPTSTTVIVSTTETSSTPPPPPPPSTTVVISTTSTLLTTATLTSIEQTSIPVQTTSSTLVTFSSSPTEQSGGSSQPTSATLTPNASSTDNFPSTTASSQITTSTASYASSTSASQVLTTTTVPTDAASISASPGAQESKSRGLSKGTQAGIAVGIICLVLLLAAGSFFLISRRRRRRRVQPSPTPSLHSRLENGDAGRASTPEMTGPLVTGAAELDGSVAGGSNGRSSRRSNFSLSSLWAPSSGSWRSRTSISVLGEDAISEAGSYQQSGLHMSAGSLSTGLSPPPTAVKGQQRGWNQWYDVPGASLEEKPGSQLARLDSGASALRASSGAVSSVVGHESRNIGVSGRSIPSMITAKTSSRTVRDSASGARFSIAELEGDSFFVPGRERASHN